MSCFKYSCKRGVLLLVMHYIKQSQSLLWLHCSWIFLSRRLINSLFHFQAKTTSLQWHTARATEKVEKKHFQKLMCQNQNTEEFLHQNQHKKGKYGAQVIYWQMYYPLFQGCLFVVFFSLKREPEQMGNAKEDERCLKSNLTSLWNTTAWCCSAEAPCFFIFSLEQADCSARYKSYAEAHASLFYFKSVCCQTWLSGISSFVICSVD